MSEGLQPGEEPKEMLPEWAESATVEAETISHLLDNFERERGKNEQKYEQVIRSYFTKLFSKMRDSKINQSFILVSDIRRPQIVDGRWTVDTNLYRGWSRCYYSSLENEVTGVRNIDGTRQNVRFMVVDDPEEENPDSPYVTTDVISYEIPKEMPKHPYEIPKGLLRLLPDKEPNDDTPDTHVVKYNGTYAFDYHEMLQILDQLRSKPGHGMENNREWAQPELDELEAVREQQEEEVVALREQYQARIKERFVSLAKHVDQGLINTGEVPIKYDSDEDDSVIFFVIRDEGFKKVPRIRKKTLWGKVSLVLRSDKAENTPDEDFFDRRVYWHFANVLRDHYGATIFDSLIPEELKGVFPQYY